MLKIAPNKNPGKILIKSDGIEVAAKIFEIAQAFNSDISAYGMTGSLLGFNRSIAAPMISKDGCEGQCLTDRGAFGLPSEVAEKDGVILQSLLP